jgi:hypothetical protein
MLMGGRLLQDRACSVFSFTPARGIGYNRGMTTTPKHRLRWYQFTIRSLLVLMVLVAVAGSWFAWKKQQVERERAAVDRVKEMRGWAIYDWEWESGGKLDAHPPGPAWLRAWLGDDFFAHVISVSVSGTTVTDAGLEHLKVLKQLETLGLENTQVTDAGLEHLGGLTQLNSLVLSGTKVTDAGLEHLKGLTQLNVLSLANTQVSDTGLGHLKGLTRLTMLALDGTKVMDAGLEYLKGLTQLRFLDLRGTKVTDKGVKNLKEALPNCTIRR